MAKLFFIFILIIVSAFVSSNFAKKSRVKRQSVAYQFSSGIELLVPDIKEDFSCDGRDYGYYADISNNCQIFHVCVPPRQQFSFFCPNETIFDQRLLVCQYETFATPCREADQFYVINQNFGVTDPEKLVRF